MRLQRPRTARQYQVVLLRGTLLVVFGLGLAFQLSGFPRPHATYALIAPLLLSLAGTAETGRCLTGSWNYFTGATFLLLVADMLALTLIVFFMVYPHL